MATITGTAGNDTIRPGISSAGVVGSVGNSGDIILGLNGANQLQGGTGNDSIIGGTDPDVIFGSFGNDTIDGGVPAPFQYNLLNYSQLGVAVSVVLSSSYAGTVLKGGGAAGTDSFINIAVLHTGSGNDSLVGYASQISGGVFEFHAGAGNDTINGNSNTQNQADYSAALAGVSVNLAANTATDGLGGTDTLLNVLRVRGSGFSDTLAGSANGDIFSASAGNDTINGAGGSDFLDYAWTPGPVLVTYNNSGYSGTAVKTGGGTDSFVNVRGIIGTASADTLIGSSDPTIGLPYAVHLRGQAGNDFIDGVKSRLNQVSYQGFHSSSGIGVLVRLQTSLDDDGNWLGSAQDGFGTTDTLKNVLRVQGSNSNDSIYGTDKSDRFDATTGNDFYDGRSSYDLLDYASLVSVVITSGAPEAGMFGFGTATVIKNGGAGGTDTLEGINNIRGTNGADMIYGNNVGYSWNGMRLQGGAGNDTIQGCRAAVNQVDYQNATAAVTIDLQTSGLDMNGDWVGSAIGDSSIGTDTLLSVNNVRASNFNDTISGTSGFDVFNIFVAGSHVFYGRGGPNDVRASFSTATDIVIDLGTTTSGTGFGGYLGFITKPGGATDALYDFSGAQGGGGNDSIYGTPGEDRLSGGIGNNLMDGRAGFNWVNYRAFNGQTAPTHGVDVDLTTGIATNYAGGTDTLLNIQNAIGTQFDDEIVGLDVAGLRTFIRGDGGNDILRALEPDSLVTADYISSLSGMIADLGTGVVSDDGWFGGRDHLINIHNIRGSRFADSISGSGLNDTLEGGDGNDTLSGGNGNDSLSGGAGDDTLNGGRGRDSMAGGTGNDRYYVDSATDSVTEAVNEGTDLVIATTGYTLTNDVENLTLTVAGQVGTGNALANLLTGSTGADTLVGGTGNDTLLGGSGDDSLVGGIGTDSMAGGIGNDSYGVDSATDIVAEGLNAGTDLVTASVSYTLGNNVENLTLTAFNTMGTGNGLANVLTGTAGADTLLGGAGNDSLLGGAFNDSLAGGEGNDILVGGDGVDTLNGGNGADIFRFATAAEARDVIVGFASGLDGIEIGASGFGAGLVAGMNLAAAGRFVSNLSGAANQAHGQFVYETDVGRVWWDADGTGAGVHVLVATLTSLPTLVAADIWVV